MALNINGTTGISGVDGSASSPALQGTDSNTGINFASDTVNINTGGVTRATVDSAGALDVPSNFPIKVAGSEKLRITSSGNLGLSTTSPVAQTTSGGTAITPVLDLKGVTQNNTSGILQLTRKDNATQGSCIYSSGDDAGLTMRNTDGNGMGFYNGTTLALRIDPSGHVYMGGMTSLSAGSSIKGINFQNNTNSARVNLHATSSAGTEHGIMFFHSGSNVGQINYGSSSTSYNTSSDYRLKENEVLISDGITRLKTLKPYRFNFKVSPTETVDGFFAHEVTAVPEAISGTKDEVITQAMIDAGDYKEGTLNDPIYQGIDQSKLVPLLTAALQEAIAKIETLETKVAALEAG